MRRNFFASVISVTTFFMVLPVWAGSTIVCPDISQATQVTPCTAEDEIELMFKASCGFERDPKATKPELCDTRAEFTRRKNTALWESSDGEFMGYVTCAVPPAKIKASKLSGVAVSQRKGMYKVACSYEGGTTFTYRTRDVCRIPGEKSSLTIIRAACGPDTSSCKVECE